MNRLSLSHYVGKARKNINKKGNYFDAIFPSQFALILSHKMSRLYPAKNYAFGFKLTVNAISGDLIADVFFFASFRDEVQHRANSIQGTPISS